MLVKSRKWYLLKDKTFLHKVLLKKSSKYYDTFDKHRSQYFKVTFKTNKLRQAIFPEWLCCRKTISCKTFDRSKQALKTEKLMVNQKKRYSNLLLYQKDIHKHCIIIQIYIKIQYKYKVDQYKFSIYIDMSKLFYIKKQNLFQMIYFDKQKCDVSQFSRSNYHRKLCA